MALTRGTGSRIAVQTITIGGETVDIPALTLVDGAGNPVPSSSAALPPGADKSGTIAAGGTAQQLAAANTSRTYLRGQNISGSDLWVNEIGGAAATNGVGSYRVPAGVTFSVNTNRAVSIFGATTGQAFTATEG